MDFIKISAVLFLLIQYTNKSSCCPEGWEAFVDEGYVECFRCRKCPEGKTAFENCTKEHDTICDECTGDEYYHILSMQCKTCTVCDAGYFVNMNCSRFNDTACVVCPTGTFSSVQSSSTCKNCTDCRETKMIRGCSRTADTVCEQTGQENGILQLVQRVLLVLAIIISVVLLICCVIHACWHRGNNGNGDIQEMQALQVRCVIFKKGFAEEDTEPLVCGHQSVCRPCNSTRDCSTCTICRNNTGNSSSREIEVNPNKKQTDKRNQLSESSEFTFDPELRGTNQKQRIKSSVSTPRDLHERPCGYKFQCGLCENLYIPARKPRTAHLKEQDCGKSYKCIRCKKLKMETEENQKQEEERQKRQKEKEVYEKKERKESDKEKRDEENELKKKTAEKQKQGEERKKENERQKKINEERERQESEKKRQDNENELKKKTEEKRRNEEKEREKTKKNKKDEEERLRKVAERKQRLAGENMKYKKMINERTENGKNKKHGQKDDGQNEGEEELRKIQKEEEGRKMIESKVTGSESDIDCSSVKELFERRNRNRKLVGEKIEKQSLIQDGYIYEVVTEVKKYRIMD